MEEKQKEMKERIKVVIDGNAFYELDMDCVRKKEQREEQIKQRQGKGQRK